MSGDLSQVPRTLAITTSTGKEFVLRRLEAVEAISRPFLVQVEVLSKTAGIKPSEVIGHTASVSIARGLGDEPRWWNGYISAFRQIGTFGTEYTSYGLEIVPKFWNLSRTSDCRVFQNESVPTIVKKVVQEGGADAPVFMSPDETPRPYCIQYNETDLDFCQRLLDETGCGYYWLFGDGEHTMMVASASADYMPLSGGPYVVKPGSNDRNSLSNYRHRTQVQPGAVRSMDYNLIKHSQLFDTKTATALSEIQNNASFEMFSWPGGQQTRPEGAPDLRVMQTFEAEADIVQAVAHDPAMTAGCKIKVALDQTSASSIEFLLTRVVHSAHDETHLTQGGGSSYSCAITIIPADRPFRPSSPRPRPVVPGLQSAIVMGPSGEEIHTDKFGRIKIRFLWDRTTKKDDTACEIWVRVAQPMAGKWGGTFFLPRVGDEVLVGFVDGDPDKPVVVGSLYSEDAPLAGSFPMPSKKTRTGFHTRSSKGGSGSTANILYFDDAKGAEQVYFHAQLNMDVVVENARTETINTGDKNDGDDTYKLARGDKKMTIGEGDFHTWMEKGDHYFQVMEGDQTIFVDKGDVARVTGEGDDYLYVEQGDRGVEVGQGDNLLWVNQGDDYTEVKQGDSQTKVSLGDIKMDATAGKIEITAGTSIELKVGGSSIKIDMSGITLKAPMIKLDAQAMLEAKSGMMTKVAGSIVQVEGSALVAVKGGFVLIN